MCNILRITSRKAKKEHRCIAAVMIRERVEDRDIDEADKEVLQKCGRKIKAGDQYVEVVSVDMGSVDSWKSHHDCASLAHKYEAWDEC